MPEGDRRDYIYFTYVLREPVVYKQVEYDYMCAPRCRGDMKQYVNSLKKKYPDSRLILKLIDDPLRLWEENKA